MLDFRIKSQEQELGQEEVTWNGKESTLSCGLIIFARGTDGISEQIKILWLTKSFTGQEMVTETTEPENMLLQE
jgi:hypothetical protein